MSYDVSKTAINRMAYCMAHDFRKHKVGVIALSPGWMRTEKVLEHFKTDERNWQQVADLKKTESTQYIGRAVVALATDPNVLKKSGQFLEVADLAREYGLTDIDGRHGAGSGGTGRRTDFGIGGFFGRCRQFRLSPSRVAPATPGGWCSRLYCRPR